MTNVNKENILKKIPEGHETLSFAKGWFIAHSLFPECKLRELRSEIMTSLEIVNDVTFYRRLRGVTVPTVPEAKKIEEVFNKFGIEEVFYKDRKDYEDDLATI